MKGLAELMEVGDGDLSVGSGEFYIVVVEYPDGV
jgi:hypothetical protein